MSQRKNSVEVYLSDPIWWLRRITADTCHCPPYSKAVFSSGVSESH